MCVINIFVNAGVATFCKVQSAFSSNEVALPLAAEEGFTGVLHNFRGFSTTKPDYLTKGVEGLEKFNRDELLKVDSEGRCIITDHGHFGELYGINCCYPTYFLDIISHTIKLLLLF